MENEWFVGLPKQRLNRFDKIYLFAMLNYKKGRFRYFDDFYTGLKQNFKFHPAELEHQITRYLALWNDVKLNAKCKIKATSVESEQNSLQMYFWTSKIDPRAYFLLKHAKIFTIEDLLEYYNNNDSFLDLERCGVKTNRLLIEICEEWVINI